MFRSKKSGKVKPSALTIKSMKSLIRKRPYIESEKQFKNKINYESNVSEKKMTEYPTEEKFQEDLDNIKKISGYYESLKVNFHIHGKLNYY